jgi:hypothetical protein
LPKTAELIIITKQSAIDERNSQTDNTASKSTLITKPLAKLLANKQLSKSPFKTAFELVTKQLSKELLKQLQNQQSMYSFQKPYENS